MLLSHKTSLKISQEYSNIIGHMCYAASKLWNICNYERRHYKELGLEKYDPLEIIRKTEGRMAEDNCRLVIVEG